MNSISSWFCASSNKNLFVKIVHPGGHVELHDRPIQAAELLNRNPKCCVAYPTVFQEPYAIISPETTLTLGQKYYVVPLGTIRKLQLKYSPTVIRQRREANAGGRDDDQDESDSDCWLMSNCNKNKEKGAKSKSKCFEMSPKIKRKKDSSEKKTGVRNRKRFNTNTNTTINNNDSSNESNVGNGGASPARLPLTSIDNWQPGLESITEE